jgi:hypothetical protein
MLLHFPIDPLARGLALAHHEQRPVAPIRHFCVERIEAIGVGQRALDFSASPSPE